MNEELFVALMERIADQMPELSTIDEDYGQLQGDENTYPMTYPCVLISTPSVQWSNQGGGSQMGIATIEVTLILDCYADTSYSSGTYDQVADRIRMLDKLHRAVQLFKGDAFSALVRTESVFQSIRGGIKAYRMSYTSTVYDITLLSKTSKVEPLLDVASVPLEQGG